MKTQFHSNPGTQNLSLFLVLIPGIALLTLYGIMALSEPIHLLLGNMMSELDQWIQNSTAFH